MDPLICPECLSPLEFLESGRAKCGRHESDFEVLFQRHPQGGKEAAPLNASCARHPNVRAVRACDGCGSPVCSVCDFEVGIQHICPSCVAATPTGLGRRKKSVTWSFVLAVLGTLALIGLFVEATRVRVSRREVESIAEGLGTVIFICSIIGTGLGVASLDRRLGNPPAIWVTTLWNGVILGIFVLLTLLGTCSA